MATAAPAKQLPLNAYTPLAPGEVYQPPVPAAEKLPELTPRSIGWGVFLCVVFTVASAYSGLKVGQVMEAAIPISILAIGLARVYRRRSTVLENVIVTGIGGVAGSVVAGAVFTLPALYILNLAPHPLQTILHLRGRRLSGRPLPDPAAPLLRARHARHVPVPGSDRHHRGAGHRRKRRIAGQAAARGHRHFRRLRFSGDHVPGVEGVSGFSIRACAAHALGAGQSRRQLRRHRIHSRAGLRDGPTQLDDPVRRRRALQPGAGAAGVDDRPRAHDRRLSGRDPHRQDDGHRDLPRLRAIRGRRRHRHGGHLRHHQIHTHRGRLLRCGRAHLPRRRNRIRRAHRPRRDRDDRPAGRDRQRDCRRRAARHAVVGAHRDPDRRGAGGGVFVLLHQRRRQRYRHHRAQSGFRHDHAHDHHLVDCAAALRPFRHHWHVLRDGAGRDGVHRAFGFRSGHHGFQSGLLARFHAGGAGEGEISGRAGCLGGRRSDHRDAGARVPVR